MGFLMGILSSIGLISNTGAATAAAVSSTTEITKITTQEIKELSQELLKELKYFFDSHLGIYFDRYIPGAEQAIQALEFSLKTDLPENLITKEQILEFFESAYSIIPEATAIEGSILASSLATAASTLGASLVIGGVAYGGYYAYQHWDEIKDYANQSVNTIKSYWP